jgi:hypothetical protein
MKNGNGYLWLAGVLGIGTGCAYIFATREGKRLRRRLYRAGEDYKTQMVANCRRMVEDGRDLVDRVFQY